MEEIVIIHTNDLHSHLENWPKMRRHILQKQREVNSRGGAVLTLDIGDFSDRVHPLTEATDGRGNVSLMNEVTYDGVTIGNNEGVGNSHSALNQLYGDANFDVILNNLISTETKKAPSWSQPFKVVNTKSGTRVALIATTAPFSMTYEPSGWTVFTAEEVLPKAIKEVILISDIIILMSHLGIEEDTKIAKLFPEIDVILGSHTHHLLLDGMLVGDTLLAAAGKFGQYIGEVTLRVDQHHIETKEATVHQVKQLEELVSDKGEVAGYLAKGHELLQSQILGNLPKVFDVSLSGPNSLLNEGLKALEEFAKVGISLLNSGLFLASFAKGLITKDDLHQCLPHPMHIIRVTLSGSDLINLVNSIEETRDFLKDYPINGMGFRGKFFGEIRYSGIEVDQTNGEITVEGKPISENQNYVIGTVDHILFVPFFPTLETKGKVEFLFPEFFRQILGDYFSKHYPED